MSLKDTVTDEYLQDIERKIRLYEELDNNFKNKWADFEERNYASINELETLREERNVKLDEIKRSLRSYPDSSDNTSGEFGQFKVSKKYSRYYDQDKFLAKFSEIAIKTAESSLYTRAFEEGIIIEKTEIAKFDQIQLFLDKYGYLEEFRDCEVIEESGAAVYGPKSIPMLGAELPKE